MVSNTFELDGFKRPFVVVLGLVLIPTGVILLQLGGDGRETALAVLFIAAGSWTVFEFGFWAPHRVTLDDSGVILEAVARRVHIPWDDLESVEPTPWDIRRETLRWRRSRGTSDHDSERLPRTSSDACRDRTTGATRLRLVLTSSVWRYAEHAPGAPPHRRPQPEGPPRRRRRQDHHHTLDVLYAELAVLAATTLREISRGRSLGDL